MMYPYMTLADETEIVHSQIIEVVQICGEWRDSDCLNYLR